MSRPIKLPTRRKEQEKLLRACNTQIHDVLNLEVLFPYLVQEGKTVVRSCMIEPVR